MKYQYPLLTLLVVLISATSMHARSAKILYLKAPKTAPQEAFLYQGNSDGLKDAIKVPLPKNNFSNTIELADGDIKLYFLESKFEGSNEDFPKNAPSVSIPAAWEKVLIFAHTDSSNPVLPIKFKVVNANQDKLAVGDLMFINSSDSDIYGMVGSQKLSLKAKTTAIITKQGVSKKLYDVKLNRLDKERNISVAFIRQSWPLSSSRSAVVFIYKSMNSNRVTYYTAPVRGL